MEVPVTMPKSFRGEPAADSDGYARLRAAIGPLPQRAVGYWLGDVTPLGAPAGRVGDVLGDVLPLPLTGFPAMPLQYEPGYDPAWDSFSIWDHPREDRLAARIADVFADWTDAERATLRRFLAESTCGDDELPVFARRRRPVRRHHELEQRPGYPSPTNVVAGRQRGIGYVGRAIIAAVSVDLAPLDIREVSARLGYSDHIGYGSAGEHTKQPRKARQAVSDGRRVLGTLGFWPWCHADDGRLGRAWLEQLRFLEPLADWLSESARRAVPRPGLIAPADSDEDAKHE